MSLLAFGLLLTLIAVLVLTDRARQAERKQWDRERQTLLNRIKPETAQYVDTGEPIVLPKAVDMFSDAAYAQETTEELAQRAWDEDRVGVAP